MGKYDQEVADALESIDEAGKPLVIVRQTVAEDPDKPWASADYDEVEEPCVGVFLNFNLKDLETIRRLPNAPELSASDRKVLIPAGSVASPPLVGDRLRDESGDWAILWVQALSPSGQDILYTLGVSK